MNASSRDTCSTCRHFTPAKDASWLAVGTCAKGGPTPEDGCSDVHRDESCEKHERKD